jgi:hypothetical protein
MVSPAREYSLEQHLLERLKFSGMQKEKLTDLVNIVTSLKISTASFHVPSLCRVNLFPTP